MDRIFRARSSPASWLHDALYFGGYLRNSCTFCKQGRPDVGTGFLHDIHWRVGVWVHRQWFTEYQSVHRKLAFCRHLLLL